MEEVLAPRSELEQQKDSPLMILQLGESTGHSSLDYK
jgi:hypothetical protein